MAIFSVFQILSVLAVAFYLIGIMNNLFSDKENVCEMTYMYEYPQFVKIKVPENDAYPQYGLYAYSEGRFTERARKMRFDGIPVLFLPGNMGSHKQVRSLASVALRKALPPSKYGFHFDYFSIDFNEEMSGLFGGVLKKQADFSTHSLKAILNLYETNNRYKPSNIIVIGHSMGGVIARLLLTYPQNKDLINLILTLASPHEAPVIMLDYCFSQTYSQINALWDTKSINNSDLVPSSVDWKNKVFISIGGGERDHLVPSALTFSHHSDIKTLTTAIPGVWLSTDHLCIVWCKQLVLVLNRFLFSIIDPTIKQLSTNSTNIINLGKHYLQAGYTKNHSRLNLPVEFEPDANWYEDSRRAYSFKHEKITKTWYYMIRLVNLPNHGAVNFQVIDLEDNDWLFGCQAKYVHGQSRVCLNGRHLSQFSQWGASRDGKRRIASLDLHALRASYPQWSHIIMRISPTYKPVQVHVDVHNKNSRQIQVTLPAMYNFIRRTIVKETELSAIRYNITLPGLETLYQAYLLYVEPLESCQATKYHASAELVLPWANGFENHHIFTELQRSPMRVRLLKGNPYGWKNNSQHASILVTLDPQCKYSISIGVSMYDALGQFSRHYTTALPAYFATILLLVMRHWASNMYFEKQSGNSFHSALCGEHVKPYYIILFARLGMAACMILPILNKLSSTLVIGVNTSQDFVLLPLLLYVVALGLAHLLGAVCWGFLVFSGQIAHRVLVRLFSFGKVRSGGRFWEWVAKEIRNVPAFGGFLLIIIGTSSCGAAALATGAAFYFFLLTKMYEDYLEDFIYKTIAKMAKKFGRMTRKKDESDKKSQEEIENTANTSNNDLQILPKSNADSSIESKEVLAIEENSDKSVTPQDSNNAPLSEANETVESAPKQSMEMSLASLHFHFSMFFIWCLVTIINIPTLLTWAHNFKYSKVLEADPSYYPSLVMSVCVFRLWQIDAPKINIKYYNILEKIIYFAAVVTIMITPTALHRLNYILPTAFALITIHQEFPFRSDECQDNAENESETIENQIKDLQEDSVNVNNIETETSSSEEMKSDKKPKKRNDTSLPDTSHERQKSDDEIYENFEVLKDKFKFE